MSEKLPEFEQQPAVRDENLEEKKAMAHAWVKQNMSSIEAALREAYENLEAVLRKNPDLADYFAPSGKDLFSDPLCEWLMQVFPDPLLGEIKKVKAWAGKPNREINHAFFMLDRLIIDPTFGQFIDVSKAAKEHPDLFEEKVLIATADTIKKVFGLNYMLRAEAGSVPSQ